MKKKKIFMSIMSVALVSFMVSCANFEGVAQQMQMASSEQETTSQQQVANRASLGDINDDGKEEKIVVDGATLKIISGTRIVQKFDINDNFDYVSLRVFNSDIDNDDESEIMVMLGCNGDRLVYNVYILDKTIDGYRMIALPEEIQSNASASGITASVVAKDGYKYIISRDNLEVTLDASRTYGISMLDEESLEKVEKRWSQLVESDFHGEVLGIYDIKISKLSNQETEFRVYEYITGGDDAIIGYLVASMMLDQDGNIVIKDVEIMERYDLMP